MSFACAALDCTKPEQCARLETCRWNVPFEHGGSMAPQPGAEKSPAQQPLAEVLPNLNEKPQKINQMVTTADDNSLEQNENVRHTCAPVEQVGVGDLQSQAPGSGARFNAGKPPMETIPVWVIAMGLKRLVGDGCDDSPSREAVATLIVLGEWQRGLCEAYATFRFLPLEAWDEAAQVFHHVTTRPVKPYPMWNWAKGMPWSVPTACAVRHLLAILRGEETDPETQLPHRGHVMCNLIMLAQYERTYREGDDRPAFLKTNVA